MNEQQNLTNNEQDENSIIAQRRQKLNQWRQNGNAYPNDFKREHLANPLHQQYDALSEQDLEQENIRVTIAGRIMLKRIMGKASFITIQDVSGKIQSYVSRDELGVDDYNDFKHWDIGDIVGITGILFKTRTQELTIRAQNIQLLSKSLRPLPEKFHGLADQEQKYRQRYLDLIVNEQTRFTFQARSRIIQSIRQFMTDNSFLEVETPMMHAIPGGAAAKPFTTHHNALDMELYLRIAPELYLKRLVVGGFEKVFEINRNFRNEGLSPRHNPEFTMMEFYAAYQDYHDMMDFTEQLIRHSAQVALGKTELSYQGREIHLGTPFARMTVTQAICHYHPEFTVEQLQDKNWIEQQIKAHGEAVKPGELGSLQFQLFEACTESLIWDPTFIIDYPLEVSPLARASQTNPDITERFELFAVGRELANGFSELNDPEDQAERFKAQVKAKDAGDEEAMFYDADYIRALEFGLAPTGGCGIGIDRLVMLLTDSPSIRDVILFPQMRKQNDIS